MSYVIKCRGSMHRECNVVSNHFGWNQEPTLALAVANVEKRASHEENRGLQYFIFKDNEKVWGPYKHGATNNPADPVEPVFYLIGNEHYTPMDWEFVNEEAERRCRSNPGQQYQIVEVKRAIRGKSHVEIIEEDV